MKKGNQEQKEFSHLLFNDQDCKLIEAWLTDGKSSATAQQYRRIVFWLEEWMISQRIPSLSKLDRKDVVAFLEDFFLSKANPGPARQNQAISIIRSLFKYGYSMGYFKYNPAATLATIPVERTTRYFIVTPGQIFRAISISTGPASDLLALSFGTGAKISELLKLQGKHRVQYTDPDHSGDCIPTNQIGSPPLILEMERKSRHIACSASMQKLLSDHVFTCGPEEYLVRGMVGTMDSPIVDNKPMHYLKAYHCVRDTLAKLNTPQVNPSIIAVSAAVHMRRRGASYEYIANQMGTSPEKVIDLISAICPRLQPWFKAANQL